MREEIQALLNSFVDAFNRQDMNVACADYAPNAVYTAGDTLLQGRDDIAMRYVLNYNGLETLRIEIVDLRVAPRDDATIDYNSATMASAVLKWTFSGVDEETTGYAQESYIRDNAGKWWAVHDRS